MKAGHQSPAYQQALLTRTDDAGLLCVHFQPKSEHCEDGQEFNLFKHALVQDAAYGTLLREPRRVLHRDYREPA